MSLAERYSSVKERVATACLAANREPLSVELIVITKLHPAEVARELFDLGHRHFGENRDQEAKPKAEALRAAGREATWHFVGQLQSNKVKSVLSYASAIHSIDRESLVKELGKQLENQDREIDGFIELNLTEDLGRGGVNEENLEALTELVLEIPRLRLRGVMAVAGLGKEPRAEFERTLQLAERVQRLAPSATDLSIGMSDDFETAISMGATHIRVGSAITGPRPA
ncbi:MAG: YggS family pyridoxal phosphate-dependent enzyme [Aquiluna sp.]